MLQHLQGSVYINELCQWFISISLLWRRFVSSPPALTCSRVILSTTSLPDSMKMLDSESTAHPPSVSLFLPPPTNMLSYPPGRVSIAYKAEPLPLHSDRVFHYPTFSFSHSPLHSIFDPKQTKYLSTQSLHTISSLLSFRVLFFLPDCPSPPCLPFKPWKHFNVLILQGVSLNQSELSPPLHHKSSW